MGVFALMKLMLLLPYFCCLKGIKIVHIHGASRKSFVRKSIIIRFAKLMRRKVVFHCHGGEFKSYVAEVGESKVLNVLSKCDAIVVLSQKWVDYFKGDLGLKNVFVINNIVEPAQLFDENLKPTKELKLLFLGAICDNKGIFDLLDVIATNKAEFIGRIKLYIGGNGEVERLQSVILQKQLAEIVEYVGWVTGEDKNRLLKDCNIVMLPSYIEGLPITLLEAMAYAKPAITTNVGGIPEVIESSKNGVIITPGDKKALYEAIRLFMDNPQLIAEYGNDGLNRVKDYYPQSVKNQLENLYKQL
jgi:glycosyltransferase involved in cell wall biosynthesis